MTHTIREIRGTVASQRPKLGEKIERPQAAMPAPEAALENNALALKDGASAQGQFNREGVVGGVRSPLAGASGAKLKGGKGKGSKEPQRSAPPPSSSSSQSESLQGKAARTGQGSAQPASSQDEGAFGSSVDASLLPSAASHPLAKRAVSDIAGMDDSHHLQATHLSYVMYDTGRRTNRTLVFALIISVVVGIGAALVVFPEYRSMLMYRVRRVSGTLSDVAHTKKHHRRSVRQIETGDPNAGRLPDAEPVARRTCRDLIRLAAGDREPISTAERIDLAECYEVVDDPGNAEQALHPLVGKVRGLSERKLNSMPADHTLADVYLTMTAVLLKEGKVRDAENLLRNRCARWEQSTACVGKLMLMADRKLLSGNDSAVQAMFLQHGTIDRKARARLALAGAQLAQLSGRSSVADQRYGVALLAAPRGALALRKQIYETQAVDLYHRNEILKLKSTVKLAMTDLAPLNPSSRTKLKMLLDLSASQNKAKTVHDLLSHEDVTYKARGDIDLIDILGPDSLRAGQEDDYLALVHRTRDYYSRNREVDAGVARSLYVWEIRANLLSQKYENAMGILTSYDRQVGADAMSHHLRGVAYALTSANERYQFLAAQEFQQAYKLKRNWESLFALGATLLRANKGQQVPEVIKDLTRLVQTTGQKYWADMLTAEWYISKAKFVNAQSILTMWETSDPDRWQPHLMQLLLYQKSGRTADAQREQGVLDDLARGKRYATSFEGFASPLGVMALGTRPID